MRYIIDTHIFIWYAKEPDKLSDNIMTILDDYERPPYKIARYL